MSKPFTPEYARKAVEQIIASMGDPEMAHGLEDHLRFEFIQAVAHGTCDDIQLCADIVATTQGLDFPRWCA